MSRKIVENKSQVRERKQAAASAPREKPAEKAMADKPRTIYGLEAEPPPLPPPGPLPPRPWRVQDYAGMALAYKVLDANGAAVLSIPYVYQGRDAAARVALALVDAMNNASKLQIKEWER